MNRSTRTTLLAGAASAATLLSMRPLVQSDGWLGESLLLVAAVTGAGLGVHRLTRRHGLAVIAQVLVVLVFLQVRFAPGTALLGVVPTGQTWEALAAVAVNSAEVVQRYSVPVADVPGLRALLLAGAGALVVAVDALATRLRHPALAGVPLAAAYAVPVSLAPGGSGALSFALAALCYLALLRTDVSGRERRWVPSAARRSGVGGLGLASAAVAVAVVVPAALPDMEEPPLTFPFSDGDPILVINPILDLKDSLGARSDVTVLSYRTSEKNPAPLRIVTADVFDGRTWAPRTGEDIPRSNRVQEGLPVAPGLSGQALEGARRQTTDISVRNFRQHYLPLPYPATDVDIDGDWLFEQGTLNVVGDGETVAGKQYRVTHLDVQPEESVLRSAPQAPSEILEEYTKLPDTLPQVVRDRAEEVTRGKVSAYEKAVELQRFFRRTGDFTYSTNAPDDGGSDAVAAFLEQRTGFCVQFASAMAVMARSLGIPARVAIGFLPGDRSGENWLISAQDAHAWPELYFEGTGWVRFEPTPATRTSLAPAWTTPRSPATAPEGSAPTASSQALNVPTPTASAPTPPPGALGAPAQVGRRDAGRVPAVAATLGGLLLLVLLLPLVSGRVLLRRRWRAVRTPGEAAEAAWAELADRTRDLGAVWPPSATPRQAAERLVEFAELPAAEVAALTGLRRAVESARFAPAARERGGERPVRADVDRIVAAVAAQRPRGVRWRALLWPSAGLRALAERGRRAGVPPTASAAGQAPGRSGPRGERAGSRR
ncbi:DUF3488 and transglutaminase-like domain-containing protein [Kineococcus sp. NUM-3379]